MKENPNIVIAGAGSIGCFVGGLLLAGGRNVKFLGRQRIANELEESGLHLSDFSGMSANIAADIHVSTDATVLAEADIVLVSVKSSATRKIAEEIKTHSNPGTIVVSLQNGVRNADVLREHLPELDVRAGMVPFNVVQMGDGHFHKGTSGEMVVELGIADISQILTVEHLETKASSDMQSVLWGKLLVNLNNALNALSNVPLVEQLSNRKWRLKLAAQMSEGLSVLKAEGITPTPPSPVPAWVLPYILRLPTSLFRAVAKQMLAIDPKARSSMWEDLQKGRNTEIDELQGEIIRLGEKHGIPTPVNASVAEEIKVLENATTK